MANVPEGFDPFAYMNDPRWVGSVYGLERIAALLEMLDSPQKRLRFVHVVGTNGKGSTCAYLACALKAAGYRVGRFTSPAVEEPNECIMVDETPIGDDDFAACMWEVAACADAMADHPTAFELQTAAALVHFVRQGCDIVVLEAGLGGKQDSTNVIDAPEVCAIVRIGLDHLGLLGDTPAAIAREKAGIVKPGCSVVSWAQEDEGAMREIAAAAAAAGAPLSVVDLQAIDGGTCMDGMRTFAYRGKTYRSRMTAAYQPGNAAIALEVIEALRKRGWTIGDEAVREGFEQAVLPGRFEIVQYGTAGEAYTVIFDGAHNEQGASALAASLDNVFPGRKPVLVTGILADKDYTGMLRLLAPRASALVCVTPPNSRALPANELAEVAKRFLPENADLFASKSYEEAVRLAVEEAGEVRLICVCGSLYQISKARRAVAAVFESRKAFGGLSRCADEEACADAAAQAAARIAARQVKGAFEGFVLYRGSNPVMISAPHAVAVTRNGTLKPIEPFTGTLASLSADQLGCPIIVKTADCGEDPNDDEESRYRDALCSFVDREGVAALLDLHQMNPNREHDVMVGTGEGANIFGRGDLLACIVDALDARGFDLVGVDEYFRALGACTVSAATARRCGIPCFQLEINSRLLLPEYGENRCVDLIDALLDAVRRMDVLLQRK